MAADEEMSASTIVPLAIFPEVTALLAIVAAALTLAEPSKADVVAVTSPVREMVRPVTSAFAVAAEAALLALPFSVAVIVPALKLPEASRATMVEPVFALVAFEVMVMAALSPLPVAESPIPETASDLT